ncbi:unnamed protein product [Rotaria socialis]|uniref:Uncharacterized protein n=1 Tax=Rotaria socialis TaxID=392032 RepID=A0A818G781_9BILA|nr:unnamed protein product [Rotaria socialis]CAF3318526.1 unnamed protein product [Rotaria socialis]CAF3333467.1 unnamed protein product [Rotaria socialis]CAF3442068.1 unnamed protein product [Rotaria socialis]CAF3485890.1 unnamed protein product [Rotaria socialis]
MQESLLNNLLKSRYPLSYYLSRQQKFVVVSLRTSTTVTPTFSEFETSVNYQHKTPVIKFSKIFDFNNSQNGMNTDHSQYTPHDQKFDMTQECIERSILKNKLETCRIF